MRRPPHRWVLSVGLPGALVLFLLWRGVHDLRAVRLSTEAESRSTTSTRAGSFSTGTPPAAGTEHARRAPLATPATAQMLHWLTCFADEIGPHIRIGIAQDMAHGARLAWSTQRTAGLASIVVAASVRSLDPAGAINAHALRLALAGGRAFHVDADSWVRQYSRPREGYQSPLVSTATLSTLQPDTEYVYAVVSAAPRGDGWCWSPVRSFRTAPSAHAPRPLTLALVADMGVTKAAQRVVRQLRAGVMRAHAPIELVVHAGDVAYAHYWDGQMPLHEHLHGKESAWDAWELLVHPLASRVPYAVAAGGHDVLRVDSFASRFAWPSAPQGRARLWYSFDYGPFHVACIFSEDPARLAPDSEQARWLREDLSAHGWGTPGREARPWLVVVGHTPLYTGCNDNATALRDNLEPLLLRHRVDFMVGGHQHVHERTYPVSFGQVARRDYARPHGTVHLNCGTGGGKLYSAQPRCSAERRGGVPAIAYSEGQWGHCELSALNQTHARFRFVDDGGSTSAQREFMLERDDRLLRAAE